MNTRLAVTAGDPRGIGPEGCGIEVDEPIGEWTSSGDAMLAGRLSGRAIERAIDLAMEGKVQGIVTAPIDKSALLAGGYDYPGHTEMLAELTHSSVAMMLAATRALSEGGNPLRVVLATTHIALRDVPKVLT